MRPFHRDIRKNSTNSERYSAFNGRMIERLACTLYWRTTHVSPDPSADRRDRSPRDYDSSFSVQAQVAPRISASDRTMSSSERSLGSVQRSRGRCLPASSHIICRLSARDRSRTARRKRRARRAQLGLRARRRQRRLAVAVFGAKASGGAQARLLWVSGPPRRAYRG